MSTQTRPATDIPRPILETLRRVIRRARLVMLVRGIAAVLATAVVALLAVMAIDAGIVLFSTRVRWLLTAGIWGITTLAALWFLVRPLARTLTLSGIARMVERHHPELQERISSAVELVSSHDRAELRGSEALIRALVDEATSDIASIRPRREVTFRSARPFLIAAGAVVAVLVLLAIAWPQDTTRLLARAVNPAANLPNVHADQVSMEPNGNPLVVRSDEPLALRIAVEGKGVRSVRILLPGPGGEETPVEANGAGGDIFRHTFPPRSSDYRFRIHAGDALTEYKQVQVVAPPRISRIDLSYDYPDYTGLDDETVAESDGRIAAVVGTEVLVTLQTNCPVASAVLRAGADSEPVRGRIKRLSGGDLCEFRIQLNDRMGQAWYVALEDAYGFTNPRMRHDLAVLPDLPPRVAVTHPPADAEISMRPDDALPVAYRARDDYGLASLALELQTPVGALPDLQVTLPEQAPRSIEDVYSLDLSEMDLDGVSSVKFRLRVIDTLPGTPEGHTVYSAWRRIRIKKDAADLESQMLQEQAASIRRELEALRESLKVAKNDSAQILKELRQAQRLADPTAERADGLTERLAQVEDDASALAREMQYTAFAPLADPLERLADQHVRTARLQAEQVRQAEHQDDRTDAAQEADFQTDRALMLVDMMIETLERVREALEREQELARMAEQQRELAEDRAATEAAQENPEQDAGELSEEEWQRRQDEMARAMQEMMEELLQESAAVEDARDLAEELEQLEQTQRQLAQASQTADELDKVREELKKLAEQQRALQEEAAKLPQSNRAERNMEDAAESLEDAEPNQAIDQQKHAAEALNDLHKAKRKDLTKEQAERAGELEKQQWELRKQTQKAMRQERRLADRMDNFLQDAMQREQEDIAREAARLAEEVAREEPEQHPAAHDAAREADAAADRMQQQDLQEAAEHAEQAAQGLQELAENTDGELAEEAGELARRQEQLAEQAAARAQEQPRAAMQQMQEATRERTEAAAERTQQLAAQAPENQAAAEAAQQTTEELENAAGAQAQAMQQMQQQAPAPAAEQQWEAAKHLQKAARSVDQMATAMAQQPGNESPQQQMAQAAQSTQQAAQTASSADAQQAAEDLEAARQAAAQAARQQGVEPYNGRQQAQMTLEEPRTGRTTDNEGAAEAGTVGLNEAQWARFHELQMRAAQGGRDTIPPHYRGLVREYYLRLQQMQTRQGD